MKTPLAILYSLCFASLLHAQDDPEYSTVSLYGGYGSHGSVFRFDIKLSDTWLKKGNTRFYLDLGGKSITFEQSQILHDYTLYSSDARVISFAGGLAHEFVFKNRVSFMPFLGLRYENVRFTSDELVNAIGSSGIVRYSDTTYTQQLGPVVDNAYGDASAFEIGGRLGIRLGKRVELGAGCSLANIVFDSATSLFGRYRGEAPYKNAYWVERMPIRFEGTLRVLLQ